MDQTSQPLPESAQAMIDAFASVGVQTFEVTYTNADGNKVQFGGAVPVQTLHNDLPPTLAWASEHQLSVIVRPRAPGAFLIQLDDLGGEMAERLRPVSFLVVETSPGNYQAWLALPAAETDPDFARRLRKAVGADANASGSVRIAGSINFKQKYAPNFPLVRIIHTQPGLFVKRAQIEALVSVAAPDSPESEPTAAATAIKTPRPSAWPSYQKCLDRAQPNGDGTGPDRSKVDFVWCQIAISWGWDVEKTADKLMELSEKAKENGFGYAMGTAQNALPAAIEWKRSRSERRGRTTGAA